MQTQTVAFKFTDHRRSSDVSGAMMCPLPCVVIGSALSSVHQHRSKQLFERSIVNFLVWHSDRGFSVPFSAHISRMVAQNSLYEAIRHYGTNVHCCVSSLAFRLGILHCGWHTHTFPVKAG